MTTHPTLTTGWEPTPPDEIDACTACGTGDLSRWSLWPTWHRPR